MHICIHMLNKNSLASEVALAIKDDQVTKANNIVVKIPCKQLYSSEFALMSIWRAPGDEAA